VIHYIILVVGIMIGLSSIGIDFTKFALFASALGVSIGFGLQTLISNFEAGFKLRLKPGAMTCAGNWEARFATPSSSIAIGTITLMRCSAVIRSPEPSHCRLHNYCIQFGFGQAKNEMTEKEKQPTMSEASERAYQKIKAMMLSGELEPGAQLGEAYLAERCGVSRTPVREALNRLESEMFVVRSESQRTFVAQWSLSDVSPFDRSWLLDLLRARALFCR